MAEWTKKKLAEVVELRRGFDLPTRVRRPGEFPVLSAGVTAGWHNEGPIKGPGFVVGRATNLGVPTWSDSDFWPLNTTLYAADFKGNNPRFLYHLFEILDLAGFDSGSVQPMLNRNYIAGVEVRIPELATQRAIAEVLRALDDKIAANERTIALLDEWIRVSFADLMGRPRPLGDLASNIRSQVQPSEIAPSTPYYGLEHLPRRRMWAFDVSTAAEVTSVKSVFHEGDILFGKLRPYFHKIVSAPSSGICSTDILVIRPNDSELAGFLLAACASDGTVRACTAASEGTRMPRTTWKDLGNVSIFWPGQSAARKFSTQVLVKSSLAFGSIRESRRLIGIRDELLPLLMSGKVRVREAEKVLEGVV